MNELELYQVKWFDYRRTSPAWCNVLFVSAWCNAFNAIQDKYKFDVTPSVVGGPETIDSLQWGSAQDLLTDSDTMRKVINKRFFADKKGMPYPEFWRFSFSFFIEFGGVADSLTQDSAILRNSISEMWDCERAQRVFLSDADRFLPGNFAWHKDQIEYFRYIYKEIVDRYPEKYREVLGRMKKEGRYVG